MNWNFMNILMFFGIVQGFLLALIVLQKKKNPKYARCFLAAMLFGLCMNLLFYFLRDVGLNEHLPWLEDLYLPWPMFAAVCFYLYVVYSAPFQKTLTPLNKMAFLPFIIFSALHIGIKLCINFLADRCNLSEELINFIYILEEYVAIGYSLLLGFLSYLKLKEHEREIQLQFSNYNTSKLIFHRRLLKLMLSFCVLWLIVYTYTITSEVASTEVYYALWIFIALVLQWIAWTGFIRDDSLLPNFVINKGSVEDLSTNASSTHRATKNNGGLDENSVYYQELMALFEQEQVYKDPNLSLGSLADKLGISKSYLSALINRTTNKNFYEFVNAYRVNHIINLFKTNKAEDFTILGLAFDSGFNSKSTFQAAFKKITSKTPSRFIKDLQKDTQTAISDVLRNN